MKNKLAAVFLAATLAVACLYSHANEVDVPLPLGASPEVQAFIQEMHAQHGFDATELSQWFADVYPNQDVLSAISPAAVPELQRNWQRYRSRFINERSLKQGLRFWQANRVELARAEAIYGVPREIIVAIIGIETRYGRNMGKFGVLEALATLAFEYPPRADFFRSELEQFLLMARENGADPLDYKGSYAGAIGIPQFMPSSQRNYAVDFDEDGRIDLRRSVADAIGSAAHFLAKHGWQPQTPIAMPVHITADPTALIALGIKPSIYLYELPDQGVIFLSNDAKALPNLPVALIDLVTPKQATEYWIGFDNFYVITRYNRSSFYAMSVFQLAEKLRNAQNRKPRSK